MELFRTKLRDRRLGLGAVLLSTVALVSCSNYSTMPASSSTSPSAAAVMKGNPNTEAANLTAAGSAVKTAGTGFTGHLGQEYLSIATARADNKDWVDADFFARKSLAASKGEVVQPEDNKNRAIPMQANLNTRGEMDQGRQRLLSALDAGGRSKYPVLAARAQARYDCWVERTEANYRAEFNGKCRDEFVAALSDLEVLLHPPGPYQVYFDNNSAKLNPEAMKSLEAAAAALPKTGTSRLEVIGKTDRTGKEEHNMKLSEARAQAVREVLTAHGVAANRIDVQGVGETQLAVPTADGVKEPRNRVTDVSAMVPESTYR